MLSQYDFTSIYSAHIALLEPNTVSQYELEKALLLAFCNSINKHPFELLSLDCQMWAAKRLNRKGHYCRPLGKRTKVSNYTVFAAALRWRKVWRRAIDCGVINHNPWQSVIDSLHKKAKACQKRPTEALQDSEVKKVLNAPDLSTKDGVKDSAFFHLIFGGALRLNEATGVKIRDISIKQNIIYVTLPHTKVGYLQIQELPSWCNSSIERILTQRLLEGAKPEDPLFPVYRGKEEWLQNRQFTHEAWRKRWEKYRDSLGLSRHYTIHSGRASACTKLLELGIDRKVVQEFMRHKAPWMIDVYDKRRVARENHGSRKLAW